jgi:hypothetical protein
MFGATRGERGSLRHRDHSLSFRSRRDEKLTAFIELEAAIQLR